MNRIVTRPMKSCTFLVFQKTASYDVRTMLLSGSFFGVFRVGQEIWEGFSECSEFSVSRNHTSTTLT